ncbi:MAG: hypothetical protein LDL41_17285 [Coleofasciculus sp. S288]|nr:hypothetical protein [Coleofasciculus sp. S288]
MQTCVTPTLNPKEIKAFVQALNALHWKTDYQQFCRVLGYTEGAYSLNQYAQFTKLCEALNNFNINSLTKFVEAGIIVDQT